MERIRGLPGKTETIFNTVVNEVDNSVKRTQAIILSPSRETAQTIYALVSAFAASVSVTTHLSIGKSNIDKDKEKLQERPHIVIGTLVRIATMLECKAINPTDVRILCIDNVQYFLSVGYEKEFSGFCEHLSKDIDAVFLSTDIRYKSSHDLTKLFTHEPLFFLVKEGLALEPSDILRDPEPAAINSNSIEDTALNAVRPVGSSASHRTMIRVANLTAHVRLAKIWSYLAYTVSRSSGSIVRSMIAEGVSRPRRILTRTQGFIIHKK